MTPKYEYPHIKLKPKPFTPEDLKDLMSYKSPIETIVDEMALIAENGVYKAVQNVNIDVNKEELEKALRYDRDQYVEGFTNGYEAGYEAGYKEGINDAIDKLSSLLIKREGESDDAKK